MSMVNEQIFKLKYLADKYIDLMSSTTDDTFKKAFYETSINLTKAADTIEALSSKLAAANMERSAAHYGGWWIPCSDRLPTMEECQKNDCRFILDDGNRRYQGLFDYTEKRFVWFNCDGMQTDKCAVRWCELPEPYREP